MQSFNVPLRTPLAKALSLSLSLFLVQTLSRSLVAVGPVMEGTICHSYAMARARELVLHVQKLETVGTRGSECKDFCKCRIGDMVVPAAKFPQYIKKILVFNLIIFLTNVNILHINYSYSFTFIIFSS